MVEPRHNEWWCKPLQKPRRLTRGDRVTVVTPCWAGPAMFPARYEAGKSVLADRFGVEVVETPRIGNVGTTPRSIGGFRTIPRM